MSAHWVADRDDIHPKPELNEIVGTHKMTLLTEHSIANIARSFWRGFS